MTTLNHPIPYWVYGKAGNGSGMETGNGNWKRKLEQNRKRDLFAGMHIPPYCCSYASWSSLHLKFLITHFDHSLSYPSLIFRPSHLYFPICTLSGKYLECMRPSHPDACKIGPGYEAIICFTYCKRSQLKIGKVLEQTCKSRTPVKLHLWSDCK